MINKIDFEKITEYNKIYEITLCLDQKKIDEINKTELKLGNNGNIRQNTPWTHKYKWEIKRKNNKDRGTPIAFRTIGFSDDILKDRPIRYNIRKYLFKKFNNCLHCGNHTDLCIDHKNDMYNDARILNTNTQIYIYQILKMIILIILGKKV